MKEIVGTVKKIGYLTKDVIVMSLSISESFTFKAGQFVTIAINNGEKTRLKSYSILNPPSQNDKQLDFCIKLIDGGFASEVFKKTKAKDTFKIKGPFGNFKFDEKNQNKENVFIGTGTGMVPLYSMIQEFAKKYPNKKFTLLVGFRKKENILFHRILLQLQKELENFTYLVTLTREEDWHGMTGRVTDHLNGDLKDKRYYICGLKEMVIDTTKLLEKGGVSKANIEYERYS
jgi:NAD(P)H-flavin reductase